jgi:O-antigen/teichoic acid export membrane protein
MGLVMALAFGVAWMYVDWGSMLGVRSPDLRHLAAPAVLAAVLAYLVTLPLRLVANIYFAHQEGARANYWTIAATVAGFLAVVGTIWCQGGLIGLIVASNGGAIVVMLASAAWLFGKDKPWLRPSVLAISREAVRNVSKLGGLFFLLQASAMGLFWAGPLVIAHYLGAASVTPYSVAWGLFGLTMMLQTALRPSLWPAYAEAFARQDAAWIRRTFWCHALANVVTTSLLAGSFVVFGREIIEVWAGTDAVPPDGLLMLFGLLSVVMVIGETLGTLLGSSGRIRSQSIYGITSAALSVGLSIWLVQRYGLPGIPAATIVSHVSCNLLPATIEAMLLLRKPDVYYVPVTGMVSR